MAEDSETPDARRNRLTRHALSYPFDPPGHSFRMRSGARGPEEVDISAFEVQGFGGGVAPLVNLEIEHLASAGKRAYEGRVPLIAAGSNASFKRLVTKFCEAGMATDFPVLMVQVSDLVPVYSAHISKYGSIPGTLTHEAGAASLLHIAFVDPAALKRINDSEGLGFNYGLALIEQLDIRLGRDYELAGVCAYVSRRGVFAPRGTPLRIDAFSVENSALPKTSQQDVLGHLRGLIKAEETLEDFIHAHIDNADLRGVRMSHMRDKALPCGIPRMGWIKGEPTGPQAALPELFANQI